MSKHLAKGCMYQMPSGNAIHPCRLIVRDGTLMWKHALLHNNRFVGLPKEQAHEQHIIKTAQRVEELNVWVSQDMEPWECIMPVVWYEPSIPGLTEGISLYFKHKSYDTYDLYDALIDHIQPHEKLEIYKSEYPSGDLLFYKRC